MYAMLVAFVMVAGVPTSFIVEERMPYDICVEVLADHIDANAPVTIWPKEGPLKDQAIVVPPQQLGCFETWDA